MEILADVFSGFYVDTSTALYAENTLKLFQKLALYYHYKRFQKTSYLESCSICFHFCSPKLAAA